MILRVDPTGDQAYRGTSHSADATMEFGRVVGRSLPPDAIVVLDGGLGTGKTCFAKGLISEVAAVPPDSITSPAYMLVNEYGEPASIAHIDFYRLDELGIVDLELLEEYLVDPPTLTVIEWGSKFIETFASDYLQIVFALSDIGDDVREVTVVAHGKAAAWLSGDPLAALR
jgi:tRNA threonylcarbamoyladenosine biosynthesis protein TsaE